MMSRGPCTFRQRDITRVLRAAKAAGVPVDIRIDRQSGDLVIIVRTDDNDMPTEPVEAKDIVL
jgi:hypothetical protein